MQRLNGDVSHIICPMMIMRYRGNRFRLEVSEGPVTVTVPSGCMLSLEGIREGTTADHETGPQKGLASGNRDSSL